MPGRASWAQGRAHRATQFLVMPTLSPLFLLTAAAGGDETSYWDSAIVLGDLSKTFIRNNVSVANADAAVNLEQSMAGLPADTPMGVRWAEHRWQANLIWQKGCER